MERIEKLVLESDGTIIDDEKVLRLLSNETFILLQPGEIWKPMGSEHCTASDSTATFLSSLETNLPSPSSLFQETDTSYCLENNLICNISENTWKRFCVPWDKVKASTLMNCEKGARDKRSIADVIHVVADAMLQIKNNVPAKAIKIVANKIITKYPKVFEDMDDDNVVLGDGSHTVFSKLKEHIKYLNRPHKRLGDIQNIPLNKRRKVLSSQAGCSNWQPTVRLEATSAELQEQLKNFKELNEEKLLDLLEQTYPLQRSFLNSTDSPDTNEIKEEWPVLFSAQGILWHYEKLMNHNIKKLCENMLSKADKIFSFGLKSKLINSISHSPSPDEKLITILKIISSYFKESLNSIYCTINEELEIDSFTINSPCIATKCAEVTDGKRLFYVVIERKIITTSSSMSEAIQIFFALFYNFNLEYPKDTSMTMEMLQKYFLKIHPDQGTKNTKKCPKTKLIGLMNKLRNH